MDNLILATSDEANRMEQIILGILESGRESYALYFFQAVGGLVTTTLPFAGFVSILQTMIDKGWIIQTQSLADADTSLDRRYYRITPDGRRALVYTTCPVLTTGIIRVCEAPVELGYRCPNCGACTCALHHRQIINSGILMSLKLQYTDFFNGLMKGMQLTLTSDICDRCIVEIRANSIQAGLR